MEGHTMKVTPGKQKGMQAVSNAQGVIAAAAMDQRGSLMSAIAKAKGVEKKQVKADELEEFKTTVVRILTPHASAILLDPEYGLPAAKARARNAGLLLAYENSGYDNTQPGRLPDLLDIWSVPRLVEAGADCIKILLYYTPFDSNHINDIKHAWVERIGGECAAADVPFFLEFVGYEEGGDEKTRRVSMVGRIIPACARPADRTRAGQAARRPALADDFDREARRSAPATSRRRSPVRWTFPRCDRSRRTSPSRPPDRHDKSAHRRSHRHRRLHREAHEPALAALLLALRPPAARPMNSPLVRSTNRPSPAS